MGNRLMFYPNILRLLAHQHAIPLERAHKLWNQAAAHATTPTGLTPDDSPDWESVMSRFLESIRCEAHASLMRSSGFLVFGDGDIPTVASSRQCIGAHRRSARN
jgi:hypothetical protein